jgi:hypothetical protein
VFLTGGQEGRVNLALDCSIEIRRESLHVSGRRRGIETDGETRLRTRAQAERPRTVAAGRLRGKPAMPTGSRGEHQQGEPRPHSIIALDRCSG